MSRRSPVALLGLLVAALMLIVVPAASAKSRDRNHDRIPDKWEVKNHLSLKVNQAKKDQDRDHMNNMAEFKAGTNPHDADTDNDGIKDGAEDSGTITSFTPASGTTPASLTITLFRNSTPITGTVDNQTEIKCEGATPAPPTTVTPRSHDDGSGDGGDNHNGAPGTTPVTPPSGEGDDDAADNEDQGDDDANEGEDNAMCGVAQLTPGTVVHEAELSTTPNGLHFDEIKLGAAPASPTPVSAPSA